MHSTTDDPQGVSKPPILSVIIVAWHSANEIGDCIRSIPRSIGGRPVEVIVVDNSSEPETREIVRSSPVPARYLDPGSNLGFGRGNNHGFRNSSGDLILYLNPDTVVNAAALEHCAGRILRERDVGFISPRLLLPDGRMDLACRRSIPTVWDGFCRASGLSGLFPRIRLFSGYNLTHLPENQSHDVGAINGAFMMGRRDVVELLGGFDESFFMYGDDLDLCIRASKQGLRIVYDGSQSILHIKGVSVAKDYDHMSRAIFDANCEVLLRHFNPGGSALRAAGIRFAFRLWRTVSRARARLRGSRRVRPA